MHEEPCAEHKWLDRLVGRWVSESECNMGPDQPPITSTGKVTFRSLGGLWVMGEGEGEMPDGGTMSSVITLGYDPRAGRFVGTFIASMMTYLWPYAGSLDDDRKVLTLDSEGPSFSSPDAMAKYQDIIEVIDDDHWVLSSRFQDDEGRWNSFMKAAHRRAE
ncbi:DUF1579 domain-containing protein [Tundrisphaera lichenicola]|uniref:DUF1579 domain-containing protein n=1 Tax=Tundrisphaera lichenicola TaxID=2029860 RepID=UPI003EBE06A3